MTDTEARGRSLVIGIVALTVGAGILYGWKGLGIALGLVGLCFLAVGFMARGDS